MKKYLDKYSLETALYPIWKGKKIYNESVLFVGEDYSAPLLFDFKKIISVRNYGLDAEYIEGIDYSVKDGKIYLTKNTSIPYFTKEEFYPNEKPQEPVFYTNKEMTKYIKFGEGGTFTDKQVCVTYKKKNPYNGPYIKDYSSCFYKTLSKLKNKENITVLFYGDSITVGANASGFVGVKPYADIWPKMVTKYLEQKFDVKINYINTAVGGVNTQWGVENVSERVNKYKPDLLFIGFGMNDGNLTDEEYKNKIMSIINSAKTVNKNIEIMLYSSIYPNPNVINVFGRQIYYEDVLKEIASEINCGITPVTSVHRYILKTKRYFDTTGNNVNHPNDFLCRIYAQTILRALLGDKFAKMKG